MGWRDRAKVLDAGGGIQLTGDVEFTDRPVKPSWRDRARLVEGDPAPEAEKPAEPQKPRYNRALAAANAAAQGFSLGPIPVGKVFDEAGAGVNAFYQNMVNGVPLKDAYETGLKNVRNLNKQYAEDRPAEAAALNIGSGLLTGLGSGAGTKSGQAFVNWLGRGGTGARVLKGAATGAASGAAYGYAGGEGGADQRRDEAGVGGLLGGLVGGAIPAVGAGARAVIKPARNFFDRIKGSPRAAANVIADRLEMAGFTPEQYTRNLFNSGNDDFAGEVGGEPLRQMTMGLAKVTGPTMQTAREAMRSRLSSAPQRTKKIIEDVFGPQENIINKLSSIKDMGEEVTSLYTQAHRYGSPVPKEALKDFMDRPSFQEALKNTAKKLADKGMSPERAGFVKREHGYDLADIIPVETVDAIQQSVGDLVKRNPITKAIEDSGSLTVEKLRQQIMRQMQEASPEMRRPVMLAAAKNQAEEAFSMGRKYAKSAAGEIADDIAERMDDVFSPNELAYRNSGFQQGLLDSIKGPLGTGNPAGRIANNKVIDRTAEVLGSQTAADKFAEKLMAEKLRMELANRALYNSVTSELPSAVDGLSSLPRGKDTLITRILEKVSEGLDQNLNNRLAGMLYATRPEDKALLANLLSQSSKDWQQRASGAFSPGQTGLIGLLGTNASVRGLLGQ